MALPLDITCVEIMRDSRIYAVLPHHYPCPTAILPECLWGFICVCPSVGCCVAVNRSPACFFCPVYSGLLLCVWFVTCIPLNLGSVGNQKVDRSRFCVWDFPAMPIMQSNCIFVERFFCFSRVTYGRFFLLLPSHQELKWAVSLFSPFKGSMEFSSSKFLCILSHRMSFINVIIL